MSNKRQHRVSSDATATVISGDHELRCTVVNVSARGMAIATGPDESLGRFVHVKTDLGAGASGFDMDAIVVRRELHPDRILWGLAFDALPPRLRSRIEAYVSRRVRSDADRN